MIHLYILNKAPPNKNRLKRMLLANMSLLNDRASKKFFPHFSRWLQNNSISPLHPFVSYFLNFIQDCSLVLVDIFFFFWPYRPPHMLGVADFCTKSILQYIYIYTLQWVIPYCFILIFFKKNCFFGP